ncbi:MAG: hypothetical protein JNK85_19825 [Verrucomicrobiales bacterium]|nr:hypothetical protein [Verrucomicrobiales bacterium]
MRILVAILWITGSAYLGAAEIEFIRDARFEHGFRAIAPEAGKRRVLGFLPGVVSGGEAAWDLDQWHSRFPLGAGASTRTRSRHTHTNLAKWVSTRRGVLTLGVDSRVEYENRLRTSAAEPWVHLLVEQPLTHSPRLSEMSSLRLRLAARLIESETFRPAGYTRELHAAQFQLVVTLGNTRATSPGFGDFLWLVVPLYDDRHAQPPRYVSRDFADPSAKLIYNPGTDAFTTRRLRDGGWVRIDRDLLPLAREALSEAWRLGYLPGSKDWADYQLTTINIGWEVPGLNRVAIALRNLSLRAATSEP